MPGWPAGYPSRGEWAFRNVTQDFMFWPTLESVSISQLHPDGITTFEADVPDPDASLVFEDDDEVRISFEGVRIWAGHVRATNKTQLSEHGPRVYELTGQDYTAKLDDSVIGSDTEQHRQPVATRVAWILTHLDYPGMTTTGLDLPDEIIEAASYGGMTVREALDSVADEMALFYYVDYEGPSGDLHMFREEILAAPFDLDDTAPDYSTSFPYSEFSRERDTMELTNAVKVIGKRHTRTVTDADSIAAYGRQESIIVDDTLRTVEQVLAAGRRRLLQLAEPIVEGGLVCWEPGLHAGMRVGIVNDLWGIDSNFIITDVEITAVDPHDDDDKALLRSEVRFTDRRRVGRFPGAGRHKKSDNKKDTSTTAPTGTCCDPVPVGEELLTEYMLSGWMLGSEITHSEASTSHTIVWPAGMQVGEQVIVFLWVDSRWNAEKVHDSAVAADLSLVIASWEPFDVSPSDDWSGYAGIFTRTVDGSEGASFSVTTDALAAGTVPTEAVVHAFIARLDPAVEMYGESSGLVGGHYTFYADNVYPPEHTNEYGIWVQDDIPWDQSEPAVWLGMHANDVGATPATPTRTYPGAGYPDVLMPWQTLDSGWTSRPADYEGGDGGYQERLAWLLIALEQPDSTLIYTHKGIDHGGTGTAQAVVLKVGAAATVDLGRIVPGPTWTGDNRFVITASGPSVTMDGTDLVVSSSTPDGLTAYASGPPDLPTSLADWNITVPFILTTAGSLTDPGTRALSILVVIDGKAVTFSARFGDSSYAQGILISGDTSNFLAKDIVESTLHQMRIAFDGTTAYAKLWEDSDGEPVAWDVSLPFTDWADDTTYDEDVFVIDIGIGNDGGTAQALTLSQMVIGGGALPGEAVDWEIVGYGDGATVTFSTTYTYDELSLQVRVDNQVLQGSAISDMDGAGASFTLSRAPYGDPSDETGSSVVEAKYVRV